MANKLNNSSKLEAARMLLAGKSVVAHDRRKEDALAIDHTVRYSKGNVTFIPYYGISNTLHNALAAIATEVKYDDRSMPMYRFAR